MVAPAWSKEAVSSASHVPTVSGSQVTSLRVCSLLLQFDALIKVFALPPFTDTLQRQLKGQDGGMVANAGVNTNTPGVIVTGVGSASDMCTQNHVGSQVGPGDDAGACQMDMDLSKSEGTQVGGGLHQSVGTSTKSTGTRSKDFNDDMVSEPKQPSGDNTLSTV